jgi:hypothetical protein
MPWTLKMRNTYQSYFCLLIYLPESRLFEDYVSSLDIKGIEWQDD